jgi:hypothetical protein
MKKLLAIIMCLLLIGSVATSEKIDIKSVFGVDEDVLSETEETFRTRSDLEILALYAIAYNELVDRYNNGNSDIIRLIPKMDEKLVDLFSGTKNNIEESTDSNLIVEPWYDYGLGQLVPDPSKLFGREVEKDRAIFANSDIIFMTYIRDCTEEEYFKFVDAIKAYGFDAEIFEESSDWYSARNEQGNKAQIVYVYPDISVEIDK